MPGARLPAPGPPGATRPPQGFPGPAPPRRAPAPRPVPREEGPGPTVPSPVTSRPPPSGSVVPICLSVCLQISESLYLAPTVSIQVSECHPPPVSLLSLAPSFPDACLSPPLSLPPSPPRGKVLEVLGLLGHRFESRFPLPCWATLTMHFRFLSHFLLFGSEETAHARGLAPGKVPRNQRPLCLPYPILASSVGLTSCGDWGGGRAEVLNASLAAGGPAPTRGPRG